MFSIGGYWDKYENQYTSQHHHLRVIDEGNDKFILVNLSLARNEVFDALCRLLGGKLTTLYDYNFTMDREKFENEISKINKKILDDTSMYMLGNEIEVYILVVDDLIKTLENPTESVIPFCYTTRKPTKSLLIFDEDHTITMEYLFETETLYVDFENADIKKKFMKIMDHFEYKYDKDFLPEIKYSKFTAADLNKIIE